MQSHGIMQLECGSLHSGIFILLHRLLVSLVDLRVIQGGRHGNGDYYSLPVTRMNESRLAVRLRI